jgi:general nucleoside transport system permease protein
VRHFGWKHIALLLAAVVVVVWTVSLAQVSPGTALSGFVEGSLGGPAAWRNTLRETTPLLLAGLAVFVALRAGLFNIGADGQLVVGAAAAAAVALRIPGAMGVVLACLIGALAGAAWAFPAGWIKARKGGHEVITTIMLNNVAWMFTTWLTAGPMRDISQQSPTTPVLEQASCLPNLVKAGPFALNSALVFGVLCLLGVVYWLGLTVDGYEVEATGANPVAAATAGVNVPAVTIRALMLSGAIAGLAGTFVVLGSEHRFYANFSPGYGFDALGVALLAGRTAWGLAPSALLFAALSAGTSSLQLSGVPKGVSGVLVGVLVILFASLRYRRRSTSDD